MIATIENAVLARLKAAGGGALGYHYKSLETYPENWDEMFKAKAVADYPAAWVVFAGLSQGRIESDALAAFDASFGLIVAARNLRNETATRHGGGKAGEPGSYQLMEDAIALLNGWAPVEGAGAIEITATRFTRPVEAQESLSLSAIGIFFNVPLGIVAVDLPEDGSLGDFKWLHANWDFAPSNGITDIPDDARADATDHIKVDPTP